MESVYGIEKTTLITNYSPFKDFCRPIVYSLESKYLMGGIPFIMIENIEKYRNTNSEFKPFTKCNFISYAYGYLINPYYTRVMPIDYDKQSLGSIIGQVYKYFLVNRNVEAVDIVSTTGSLSGLTNFHLYIGLSSPQNVMEFYRSNFIRGMCEGFSKWIQKSHQITIRTSHKYTRLLLSGVHSTHETRILPVFSYRRVDENSWKVFQRSQIIPPINNYKDPKKESKKQYKKVLRLR